MRHHVHVGLDLFDKAKILQPLHDQFSRGKTVGVVQLFGQLRSAFRKAAQIILVVDEGEAALLVEHVDLRQAVALADLEIVEVVRRRDLDRAGALFRIGVFVADDRNTAADQRKDDMLADQMAQPLVLRMNRDGGVAEHGFRAHGCDHDE